MQSLILRPIISEKSAALAEVGGQYVFEVLRTANKLQVRQAVEKGFGVKVDSVRTLIVQRDWRRTTRGLVKPAPWKKAIVRVAAGQKIDIAQLTSELG